MASRCRRLRLTPRPRCRPTRAVRKSPTRESRARTVKLRNVIAVAVVSVLLLGGGWVWSLSRDGVSASDARRHSGRQDPAPGDAGATTETRGGVPENTVAAPEAPPPPQAPPDNTYKRDIVTTGSVQMVVAEPTQVADRLVSAVTDAGGRVDSRSERSGSSSPTVDLVLRIPADKLDGVLADAKKLGTVESMSIGHTDVTSQRVDLDARIEALQTSVNRLLELMGRAGNVADLLAAESSLTQRQAELDSLRAQRAALGDQISYATINVNLSAKPTVTHGGFLGALERGWQSLLSAVHGVVVTVGFLIPWIPVLAVLALVIVVVLRRKPFRRASSAAGARQQTQTKLAGPVEFLEPGQGQIALVGIEDLQTCHAAAVDQDEHDKRNLDRDAIGRGAPQDLVRHNAHRRMHEDLGEFDPEVGYQRRHCPGRRQEVWDRVDVWTGQLPVIEKRGICDASGDLIPVVTVGDLGQPVHRLDDLGMGDLPGCDPAVGQLSERPNDVVGIEAHAVVR